jgi:hypothetical protein
VYLLHATFAGHVEVRQVVVAPTYRDRNIEKTTKKTPRIPFPWCFLLGGAPMR